MELMTSFSIYGAICLFFVWCYFQLSKTANPNKQRSPPEAEGAWPIIGHLHLMSDRPSPKLPHFNLGALADKYGPAFTVRIGAHRALVLSNWELAKEVFTKNDAAISSHPQVRASKHFALLGLTPYGPYLREIRKLAYGELLSHHKVELMNHVRMSEIAHTTKELYKLWEEKQNGSGQALVDMKWCIGVMNLNIVLRMVAGKRFDWDTEEARQFLRLTRDLFHLSGLLVPADVLPCLRWFDFGGFEKRMKDCAMEFDALVGTLVEEHHIKGIVNNSNKEFMQQRDLIDVMLSLVKDKDFQTERDAKTIIKSTAMNLIAGGTDTTTGMIIWAISLLLNNRHVLKKAQEELDTKIGKERRVNEYDINKLEYLQAIVKETFRLFPAGPLAGRREFSEDCTIGGYHIPKGTWLIVNVWKLQQDPSIWIDPTEFKPERFVTEPHMDKSLTGTDFELIPFGAGRRICPGANFGIQILYLGLASFLHAFEFSTVSDELVDMSGSVGLTNSKASPLDVFIKPRLSPHLYNFA